MAKKIVTSQVIILLSSINKIWQLCETRTCFRFSWLEIPVSEATCLWWCLLLLSLLCPECPGPLWESVTSKSRYVICSHKKEESSEGDVVYFVLKWSCFCLFLWLTNHRLFIIRSVRETLRVVPGCWLFVTAISPAPKVAGIKKALIQLINVSEKRKKEREKERGREGKGEGGRREGNS